MILSAETRMLSTASMKMDVQAAIWRGPAQEAATAAAQMNDPELRLSMLAIAASYAAMAKRAASTVTARDQGKLRVAACAAASKSASSPPPGPLRPRPRGRNGYADWRVFARPAATHSCSVRGD